jgi:hypothetical protein
MNDRLDHIAKRYAEDLIEDAISDAAQDRLYEYLAYQAEEDELELTVNETDYLRQMTYDLMLNSAVTV